MKKILCFCLLPLLIVLAVVVVFSALGNFSGGTNGAGVQADDKSAEEPREGTKTAPEVNFVATGSLDMNQTDARGAVHYIGELMDTELSLNLTLLEDITFLGLFQAETEPIVFSVKSVSERNDTGDVWFSWYGESSKSPAISATLVASLTDGYMHASMTDGRIAYTIRGQSDESDYVRQFSYNGAKLDEISMRDKPAPPNDFQFRRRTLLANSSGLRGYDHRAFGSGRAAGRGLQQPPFRNVIQIKIGFSAYIWEDYYRRYAGAEPAYRELKADAQMMISQTANAMSNSDLFPFLNFDIFPDMYMPRGGEYFTTDRNATEILYDLRDGRGVYFSNLKIEAANDGTDVIVFITSPETEGAGVAFLPERQGNEQFGYAVVRADGATTEGYYAFAHEIGHILGAQHDAFEDVRPPARGYIWPFPRCEKTIMSYSNCDNRCTGCPSVLQFSTFDGYNNAAEMDSYYDFVASYSERRSAGGTAASQTQVGSGSTGGTGTTCGATRCGANWADANNNCKTLCATWPEPGWDACPPGESCFGDLSTACCSEQPPLFPQGGCSSTRCGTSWTDANSNCKTNCAPWPEAGWDACPDGESCFGDLSSTLSCCA